MPKGGAIWAKFDHVEVIGSELSENEAIGGSSGGAGRGGAIFAGGSGGFSVFHLESPGEFFDLYIGQSVLFDNVAQGGGSRVGGGGAVWAESNRVGIIQSTLDGNIARGGNSGRGIGGGIYGKEVFGLDVVQSTLSANIAQGGNETGSGDAWGGGVYVGFGSNLRLDNSTLSTNQALAGTTGGEALGGGAYTAESRIELRNVTVTLNQSLATVGVGKGGGVAAGDPDRDHDHVDNRFDNAPDIRNSDQRDDDFDGIANVLDPDIDGDTLLNGDDDDIDGDGVLNGVDNAPNIANADQSDFDADGVGDVIDNAFSTPNPDQLDTNGDGIGDVDQQGDNDGDGVLDFQDNAPFFANPGQEDVDGDGLGDVAEEQLVILTNTVIAGNTADSAPDVSGHFYSEGGNFVSDGTGSFGFNPEFIDVPDQVGTGLSPLDPLLGPLAENGGLTRTHLPLVGSPLIDAGDKFNVFDSYFLDDGFGFLDLPDQRGFDRFVDGDDVDTDDEVDIGATEFGALSRPALEFDSYDHALLQVVVEEVGTGVRHTLVLEGFTSHVTLFDVFNPLSLSQEGDADDTDHDGLDEVVTYLANAIFFGESLLGSIFVQPDYNVENNGLGEIEETTQTNAGRLDLPPFGTGTANSFFDLSFFVYVDSTEYYHETPMRLQGTVSLKPAGVGDTFQLLGAPVLLLDGDDNAAFTLIEVNYTPLPEPTFDYSDAPESFPTRYFEDGARHFLSPVGPIFGTERDVDADGQPTPLADGDDLNSVGDPDDEDGIDFKTVILAGENASVDVTVTALPGTDAEAEFFVNAWLDFNGDGDWNDAFEHIINDAIVTPGTTSLSFSVPGDARGQDHATARFRVSTVQDLSFSGFAPDGEVEDYSVGVAIPPRDFGDALGDFYATTIDGPFSQFFFAASHDIVDGDLGTPGLQPSLFLGAGVDADLDGQPTATANGDDTDADGDDDDGVFQINAQGDPVPFGTIPLVFGQTGIAVRVIASGPGVLNGWLDFTGDGSFDNGTFLGEHIFDDVNLVAGVNNLTFDYPDNFTIRFLSADQTFARFRFSSTGGLNSFGAAADGEVEDYPVQLRSFDFGDAPDSYGTLLDSDPGDGQPDATPGAQHVRSGPMFGFRRDAEFDGQPSPPAGGDDFGFTDDEDGVRVTALVAGFQGDVTIFVSQLADGQTAYVDGWIDYDNNGTFDPDEQILTDAEITAEFFGFGARTISFVVPADVVTGVTTFARFRVSGSANGVTSPIGLAEDGEVEDYAYFIFEPVFPDEVEEDGTLVFVDVTPGPVARDPAFAQGYDYFTPDAGNFKSVELPAFGDNIYFLHLSDGAGGFLETPAARLEAGTTYDFTAGFLDADNVSFAAVPAGLDSFRILGIETTAEVDIADGLGFPTILDVTATTTINMLGIPEKIYVDQVADFINETNPGNAPVAGDFVTWIGSDGTADDVTGLVFGTSAFATVQGAIDYVEDNDFAQLTATTGTVIQIAPGTFTENLLITSGATLAGSGAVGTNATLLDGNHAGRVLDVVAGATVSISSVVIQNGSTATDENGGGVRNFGTLIVTNSVIDSNSAGGLGGGIYNESPGAVNLLNSTISNNSSSDGGGGLWNQGGIVNITNSTISGNTTVESGGGVLNFTSGVATILNSTITNNRAETGASGGIGNFGTATLHNTILAGNFKGLGATASDTENGLDDGSSFNVIGTGGSGGLINSNGNQVDVADPLLGPLTDNDGLTPTHALLTGSPAINAGSNALIPEGILFDQRGTGFDRIEDSIVDIGAFESPSIVNFPPTAVSLSPNPASIDENTDTTTWVKVADITITDDGLGTNALTLTGDDADAFKIDGLELFVTSGVILNFENKTSYSVTVEVDDTDVGVSPDATVSFTLNINDINDAPTVAGLNNSTDEDTTFNGSVSANDEDDSVFTFSIVGSTPAGVTFNPNGSFSVTPQAADQALDTGESRIVTFDYKANDGEADSNTSTVSITINGVNDAPTVANLDDSTDEDTIFNGSVSAIDVDDSAFTFSIVGSTPDGVTFNPDGSFSVTPLASDQTLFTGESRLVTFDYKANDGETDSNTATASITIDGVNDAPTLDNAIADQIATEGTAFTFQFDLATFSDIDASDSLTYSANRATGGALPSWLTFNAATRTFAGTPANTDVGTLSVRVTARDSGNLTVTEDFDIAVIGVLITNVGGTVTITDVGGASNDSVGLSLNATGDALVVTLEGSTFEFPLAGLTNVVINAGSGNDTLNLDLSNGAPPLDIVFNGGTAGHDTLNLTGFDGSGLDAFTANYSNRNDGDIQLRTGGTVASTVTYTGLEPISIDGTPTEAVFNLPNGNDTNVTLRDIGGADGIMRLSGSTFETTDFSIGIATSITINANAGNDRVTIQSIDSGFHGALIVHGGAGNDRLEATASTIGVDLRGDAGNDTLTGSAENDTLSGGLGNDSLNGGAGIDTVADTGSNLTLKNTTLTGNGNDKLANIERASLTGTAGNNVLDASAFTLGNVTLSGAAGNDTLLGSAFVGAVDADGFNDSLDGGEGTDTARQSSPLNQTLSAGPALGTTVATGLGSDLWTSIEGAHLISSGKLARTLDASAFSGRATLEGGAGNDTLIGGSGNNVLNGKAGNDSITGGNTVDTLIGGAGNDTLLGLAGSDQIQGQAGNDLLVGGSGDDRLFGDTGRDTIVGGDGQDVIDGGADNDLIAGNSGHDLIFGGSGNDTISGGDGDDTINGGAGNDTILGGNGTDVLRSGSGSDRLSGGTGDDRFEANGAVIATGGDNDTIVGNNNSINEVFTFDFDRLLIGIFT